MKVLVTGATGFIGGALIERLLLRGDRVTALTRGPAQGRAARENLRWASWEPMREGSWHAELAGQDAVIHLAGATAVGRRYTEAVREEILSSRVRSTEQIIAGFAKLTPERQPRVFVCASGVGFYGSREDDAPLDELAEPGRDFLAQVCVAWEDAARGAERHGIRTVMARTGYVLGRDGGALAKLVPLFKSYAGGRIGSGKQIVPWIHLDDLTSAYLFALGQPSLIGPVNFVGPSPVTNAEFSAALAKVLKRPALFPVPPFALRALFGDGAVPLVGGQNVRPQRLESLGFSFRFSELEVALRDLFSAG